MIDPAVIQKVKDISILEVVGDYTALTKHGNIHMGQCPNPNHNDNDPSFRVWEGTNTWNCMVCNQGKKDGISNFGSDTIAFIRWIEGLSFPKAVEFLAEKYGVEMEKSPNSDIYNSNRKKAIACHENITEDIKEYLERRGLDKNDISEWLIGYNSTTNRIEFPLFDRNSEIVGFSSRVSETNHSDRKYINSPNSETFCKAKYLYGMHKLDKSFKEVRIVEGPLDLIIPRKYGAKNILATLGTAFTKEHVDMIKNLNSEVVLIYDNDEAGNKAAVKTAELLIAEGIYPKVLELEEGKDLRDIAIEKEYDIETYINEYALSYGSYLINSILIIFDTEKAKIDLRRNLNINALKIQYSKELQEQVDKIPCEIEKKIVVDFIEKEYGIDLEN